MTQRPNPALLPSPALFDVTTVEKRSGEGTIRRVALEHITLAANQRRHVSPDGIERLAGMLMRSGQLVPCIGHRPNRRAPQVTLYAGQRRLLAAQASQRLAGSEGYEGLEPVVSLVVLLVDHEPGAEEIRRIQAQENQREELTLVDQQEQFRDAWAARTGLREDERVAAVCADLGISAKKAHNLRRQLTLPEPIRDRVADRPSGEQISVTMASRLADMHDVTPQLTEAVARRITSSDLHDKALRDLGGFVHRTIVEDEHTYAVRIDDGAMLDAHDQVTLARGHLDDKRREHVAGVLGCKADKLGAELDALAARATERAAKIRVDGALRERASNGRYAYVHDRGADFAAGIWVIDPAFMLDVVVAELKDGEQVPARDEQYFAGAKLQDDDMHDAAEEERARKARERERRDQATASNLGLGHDIRAGLMDPSGQQLHALKGLVCHLLAEQYREVIAYGAGWSDQERQQPVGDSQRLEPRQIDAIVDAELQRALDDPDPLRGIAELTARWGAAFMLDPDGVTRTKALGVERMSRKLRDALPGGDNPLRASLWEFMRPMLSPRLIELHRDAFLAQEDDHSTVDLDAHRGDSDLDELDLDDDQTA